jgi:hypothetical protein
LAQPITGIFIDGDDGGNSLFGGHDNMVGKRISQEFSQLQHRRTLAMITDESMTSQKCIYCLHRLKHAHRGIYDGNGEPISKPSRGTFICTNHNYHASTMSRDLMSSELMGMKPITASIGFPLPRKNEPNSYQNLAEKALAVLLQVSTSLKQDLTGALRGDFYIGRGGDHWKDGCFPKKTVITTDKSGFSWANDAIWNRPIDWITCKCN